MQKKKKNTKPKKGKDENDVVFKSPKNRQGGNIGLRANS